MCLCGFLALLVYLNSLPNDFVVDDRPQIVDNAFLRRPDGLKKIFTTDVWAFFGQERAGSFYRPLMHSVFYAGWRLFHQNATGYRAGEIALQEGDRAEARRLFSHAAALDPANARARAGLERMGHR